MSLSTHNFQHSDSLVQDATKIVMLCERSRDESAHDISKVLSSFSASAVHVVELHASKTGRHLSGCVLRSTSSGERLGNSRLVESDSAQRIWDLCGPGAADEQIIRYCMRIGAQLVIVPENLEAFKRPWWGPTFSENLSRHVPFFRLRKKPTGSNLARDDGFAGLCRSTARRPRKPSSTRFVRLCAGYRPMFC
jgi:hypothetical protein